MLKKLILASLLASMLLVTSAFAKTVQITYGDKSRTVTIGDGVDLAKAVDTIGYLVEPFGYNLQLDTNGSVVINYVQK